MRRCQWCKCGFKPATVGQVVCGFRCARKLYEWREAMEETETQATKQAAKLARWKVAS